MIPLLMLAAGASARMRGADKLLRVVDGQPLLRRSVLQALDAGPVFVALHHNGDARQAALTGLPVTILRVSEAAEGQSGTLRGALAQMPPAPAVMILLADMPDLTAADLAAVLAARRAQPDALVWRGATPDGKPGHPVLVSDTLRPRFADLRGDSGATAIIRAVSDRTVLVRFVDNRARLDLDTPEAWDAWDAARR